MKNGITRLDSGGIITNYSCTSRCRHCLYNSSPAWGSDYITPDTITRICRVLKKNNCSSIHIGGGEPFLGRDKLVETIRIIRDSGINIDYIETNSSWFKDSETDAEILKEIRLAGCSTLLISISPFHNEYIPLNKIKGVMTAARNTGITIFPWVEGFLPDLMQLDPERTHTIEEYVQKFGPGYIESIPKRYWITMRGRALQTYAPFMNPIPVEKLIKNSTPCRELFDVSHFHFDVYGNYIPGLCSGFSVTAEDIASAFSSNEHPLLSMLAQKGIGAAITWAQTEYGFQPKAEYVSKCALCTHLRTYLVIEKNIESPELGLKQFYKETAADF